MASGLGSSTSSVKAVDSLAEKNAASAFQIQEIPYKDFAGNGYFNHRRVKVIATDEITSSDKEFPITSSDIGDCITMFGISKERQSIFGYHIDSDSSKNDIKAELEDNANADEKYQIYLIGGNGTALSSRLLIRIRSAVNEFFEDNAKIVGEMIDTKVMHSKEFISANLKMDGSLTFCRHDNRRL